MMLGSKGILPPMIHGLLRISCSRNPENIRNPPCSGYFLMFYGSQSHAFSCKHETHNLLTLVSLHKIKRLRNSSGVGLEIRDCDYRRTKYRKMYDEGEHFSIFCTDVGVRTNSKPTPDEFRNRLLHKMNCFKPSLETVHATHLTQLPF